MSISQKSQRISKIIAHYSNYSRREAEKLISCGMVKLNGKIVESPAINVTDNDEITVEGKPLLKEKERQLWALYKPRGFICSRKDEQGRRTIYDILPMQMQGLMYVGRLDMNSEGLLLLTNDSELKQYLEHPKNKLQRIYEVRVYGDLQRSQILNFSEKNIVIKDVKTGQNITYFAKIEQIKRSNQKYEDSKNHLLRFTLKEGKNREIRRICEKFGLQVNILKRISFAQYQLGNMKAKEVQRIM